MSRRIVAGLVAAPALAACTLLVSLDDLATSDAGADARPPDAQAQDGGTEGAAPADGGDRYRAEVLADVPVAYWRLGEERGVVARNEVNGGSAGNYTSSVKYGVEGAIRGDRDTAIALDGAGSIDLGDGFAFSDRQAFSLEAWVKPTKTDTEYRSIFGHLRKNGMGRQGYALWNQKISGLGLERNRDYSDKPADFCGSDEGLPLDVYSHVVATYDGMTLRLYVDGREAANAPSALQLASFGPLVIGGGPELSSFHGSLDEVAVYDRALAAARIAAHHAAGVGQ